MYSVYPSITHLILHDKTNTCLILLLLLPFHLDKACTILEVCDQNDWSSLIGLVWIGQVNTNIQYYIKVTGFPAYHVRLCQSRHPETQKKFWSNMVLYKLHNFKVTTCIFLTKNIKIYINSTYNSLYSKFLRLLSIQSSYIWRLYIW